WRSAAIHPSLPLAECANQPTLRPEDLTMTVVSPRSAMVLAAGRGTRMRPLTDTTAKPLLKLGSRPLLDLALDHLAAEDVDVVAVNAHWKADAVAEFLTRRSGAPLTVLLREATLLDTGGAVRAALPV